MGYEQRNHSDTPLKDLIKQLLSIDQEFDVERQAARKLAIEASDKIRNYNRIHYSSKHNVPTGYNQGDFVGIRDL